MKGLAAHAGSLRAQRRPQRQSAREESSSLRAV